MAIGLRKLAGLVSFAVASFGWSGAAAADMLLQVQTFGAFGSSTPPQSWTAAMANFTANAQANGGVTISVQPTVVGSSTSPWTLRFSPRVGQPFGPGTFDNAAITPTAAFPGLDVYSGPSGCATSYGQFTVFDLVIVSGAVTQFAADFEEHCNGSEPIYVGGIRFNSAVPYVPQGLAPLPPASLQLASQAQEWIGQSFNGTLTRGVTSDFTFGMSTSDFGATLNAPSNTSSFQWRLLFSAPAGTPLVPGLYDNATIHSAPAPGRPSMLVYTELRACVQVTGRFNVLELELGPTNQPIKLAIDFEQHCDGAPAPLYGALRLNSSLAFTPGSFPVLPSQLRMIGGSTMIARLGSGSVSGPSFQVLDATGNAFAGGLVRFNGDAGCGTFVGGQIVNLLGAATSQVDVPSDASGMVAMPAFTPTTAAICYTRVILLSAPSAISPILQFVIYDPALLSISPNPFSLNTSAGQPFHVGLFVYFQNFPLPNLQVTASVASQSGAGAMIPSPAMTNQFGQVDFNAVANAYGGNYSIVLSVEGRTQVIPVVQSGPSAPVVPPLSIGNVQDMWWGGPTENGWGMSLVQHNDTLFAAMYIYDAGGKPTWLVMPGGAWDSTHTIYNGSLYAPQGTPFFAYDASRLVVGSAAGNVTITFQDANDAILDYTIGGVSSRKLITREIFANGSVVAPDRSDLWWGGIAQNGWGITILQQASTLFPVWFTYDASGAPIWYVMPVGTWASSNIYEGHVYRTTGSSWVGVGYDPTKLQVFDVGTYRIQFNGDNASFNYTVDGRSGTMPLVREPF